MCRAAGGTPFYQRVTALLHKRTGIRTEDVTVILVENGHEDCSSGRAQANYIEPPVRAWR
jgi:hypothetical protein